MISTCVPSGSVALNVTSGCATPGVAGRSPGVVVARRELVRASAAMNAL